MPPAAGRFGALGRMTEGDGCAGRRTDDCGALGIKFCGRWTVGVFGALAWPKPLPGDGRFAAAL